MKTALLLLSVLSAGMILSACTREQDQLSPDQLNAVREMERTYQLAKAYNDSLIAAHSANASLEIMSHYDSMYHLNVASFETCHHAYQHSSRSANHSHDGQGKVQMHRTTGSMMGGGDCQCCTNGGHRDNIHDQMAALHHAHALHHP